MASRVNPAEALMALARLKDPSERRAKWRQAVAALGQGVRVMGPSPIEAMETRQLVEAARTALLTGLVDDLDWIEPGRAAVALLELMSALPHGHERRELGRRVFARLYEGTAATFATVATRLVFSSARSLETATLRARVALLFELPVGSGVSADALALAIVSRHDTLERWVGGGVTGTLPERRLAARLLQNAAREALFRAQQGDRHPLTLLLTGSGRRHFERLLADREPLVWRHAAIARGLVAGADRVTREEIELALDPSLTPTEWRRASVSLVALVSVDPDMAFQQCRSLLAGPLHHKDPGLAAALVAGLPPVIEAEPERAEELLALISRTERLDVAEAVADLLADLALPRFGREAAERLRNMLSAGRADDNPAVRALLERALRVFDRTHVTSSLEERVREALVAFETRGAKAAYGLARETVADALERFSSLSRLDPDDDRALPEMLRTLSDLDATALEHSRLFNLLLLSRRPGDADARVPLMEQLYDSLGQWILAAEESALAAPPPQQGGVMRQRRLRSLLHLVDIEAVRGDADLAKERVRERVKRTVRVLVASLGAGPPEDIHRILCATLARTLDAVVREGIAEPSDILLSVVRRIDDERSVRTLAEATTHAEIQRLLVAHTQFLDGTVLSDVADDPDLDEAPLSRGRGDVARAARRIVRLSHALNTGGTYRGEALRQVVLRLGRALEGIAVTRGLNELVESEGGAGLTPVHEVEWATEALRQMLRGALRRVLDETWEGEGAAAAGVPSLAVLVERAFSERVPPNRTQMQAVLDGLNADLPSPFAQVIASVLARIAGLPASGGSDVVAIPLEKRRLALPDWLLPKRTIGAFYVVRALGAGGVSSVFVARRLEERHDPDAELFALKVPEYDPTTARSLSEQEFLDMFRDEAGALLALPQHPNLARFVNFDLAARPKPILVMELIGGAGLDRLVRSRSLTTEQAFRYLLGILTGLQAMHDVGVGHLDIKPSNVILRDGEIPVLVDFGLAGRQLRPGCGSLDYCSPEVLGVVPEGHAPTPQAADIYAFGSMAFEILTAHHLFDDEDEMAMVSNHVSHDGWPDKLARMAHVPKLSDVAVLLAACLRRDPRQRPSARALRDALPRVAEPLKREAWPLLESPRRTGLSA